MTGEQGNAVRRKVEAWLKEPDAGPVLALKAPPEWGGDEQLTVGSTTIRVVPCATPLAARAAIHDRRDGERLVLLTPLSDDQLGAGVVAHVSRNQVRSINPWDLVRQMFAGSADGGWLDLDPTLVRRSPWAAEALSDYEPEDGWPKPPGKVLTREHVLGCLAAALLGLDRHQVDSAGLLEWSTNASRALRFRELPAPVRTGIADFLADQAGPAAAAVMAAVERGHGVDAIPIGLLADLIWPASITAPAAVGGRARLEGRIGKLTDVQAAALAAAAVAWLDRTHDSDLVAAQQMLRRAEQLANQIEIGELLGASPLLPAGLRRRLGQFADAVRMAVPAGALSNAAEVSWVQALLPSLAEHRAAEPAQVETARMAVRLLRWLGTPDPAPRTLYDALLRQVREDAWVDRARLDIFAGASDEQIGPAYGALHRAVDNRRARHDKDFAQLLSGAVDAEPGALLRVEDVLDGVVQPILDAGQRVLLLVLDGMGTAAAAELAEAVTRSGSWLELTPGGGERVGVLAALPTMTEVSRCSLLSGRIAVGGQEAERKAFKARYPHGELLHKGDLRAGAGAALPEDVVRSLDDPACQIVAAVVNTIDDALDRSDPGTTVWGTDTIVAVRDLLSLAQDRIVVLTSDHGHVVDRGPEGYTRSVGSSENRWRPATTPPDEDEVAVRGQRVARGGGEVILPWREQLRYGPRKAGYHGGASPAEAVIPLVVFSAGDEDAVPGWAPAPIASPVWWREPVTTVAAVEEPVPRTATGRPRRPKPEPAGDALFDLDAAPAEPVASPAAPAESDLVARLLASPTYAARKRLRAPLPDERVSALLGVLIAGHGRATYDNLAALAGVPAHRIRVTVTELRRLLQVEGYSVVTVDPDEVTVLLDIPMLREQFQL